jgi:hypothetical protein
LVALPTLGFVLEGLGVFGIPGSSEIWLIAAVVSAATGSSLASLVDSGCVDRHRNSNCTDISKLAIGGIDRFLTPH